MIWVFMLSFMKGEHRDALEMTNQGKRAPSTATSALTSTFESVGASFVLLCPFTLSLAIGLITVPWEFLQCLVEYQNMTNTRLVNVEIEVASLYR